MVDLSGSVEPYQEGVPVRPSFYRVWLSHLAAILLEFAWLLGLAACAVRTQENTAVARPPFSESWPQFDIFQKRDCPRQVTMLRLGAGDERPAEFSVWEWVENQERLCLLWKTKLRNPYSPKSYVCCDGGRFLVTFDDWLMRRKDTGVIQRLSAGTTDNCVVMYDFARGRSRSFRLEQFAPDAWLAHPSFNPDTWMTNAYMHPENRVVFVTSPSFHRRILGENAPFVVLDLMSLRIQVMDRAPVEYSKSVYADTEMQASWGWTFSMGKGAPLEPDWGTEFALPTFLKATRVRDLGPDWPFQPVEDVAYFRLDAKSGDYVRCPAEDWHDRFSGQAEKDGATDGTNSKTESDRRAK